MRIFIVSKFTLLKIIGGLSLLVVLGVMSLSPVQSVFKEKKILPIYNVEMEEKKVAISFDAAWGADDTTKLLEALRNADAKATFFLVGKWAEKYPKETKMISDAGHEIGNHSYKHPDMTKLSEEDIKTEILKANEAIKNVTGKEVTLYRPPFGSYDNKTMKVLDSLNMHTIQWDVDSLDWKDLTEEQIIKKVVPKVKPGSIVLFHNNAKHTAAALPAILKALKDQGYQFVSISDLIIKDKEKYYINHKGTQIRKESNTSKERDTSQQKHSSQEIMQDKKDAEEQLEDVINIIDTTL